MLRAETEYFNELENSYRTVGSRTWQENDFLVTNLEVSRNLFTPESLAKHQPKPRALEVFALLSGLPFDRMFTGPLVDVQKIISDSIGDTLHYWVAPENMGVEHCVFKWPDEIWQPERRTEIEDVLESIQQNSFRFEVRGIQINSDGCVVAKGFDEGGVIPELRTLLRSKLAFFPTKQSGWAHVPLGRILEPVGTDKFVKLRDVISAMSVKNISATNISSLKFIHEKRWYMEERTLLAEYALTGDRI